MTRSIRSLAGALDAGALLAVAPGAAAQSTAAESSVGGEIMAAAAAANRFLGTLDPAQARAAVLPAASPLIGNWSNLPAGMVRFARNGVCAGDLNDVQRATLFDFLAAALRPRGAELVRGVIAAETVLAGNARAARLGWSPDNYWIAFFGEPTAGGDWKWQFGGHHLALNIAVTGGAMSTSPSFIEPATFTLDRLEWTPLSDRAAAGAALLAALPAPHRTTAMAGSRPRELYAGAGRDGVIPPPEGSRAGAWADPHRRQLPDLIGLWAGIMPPAAAQRRLAQIEAELAEARFAWHGPADGSGAIYYRIQGPTLLIEFSTQDALGATGHYHSIYRNPTNEYGRGRAAGR